MSSNTLDFTGQKVVVIGGTSGMGLAVARRVLQGGGSAVVTGRTQASAAEAAAELAEFGNAVGLAADLFDSALEAFNDLHPLGRIGTPEDVAPTVAFLSSCPTRPTGSPLQRILHRRGQDL
ncbi:MULTISPECIES: SDR family NAD(P)-dependent oxidoreductase [Streptomyces]|uniref:SDR family NAD(P)-dependent oxidoreductase n=1 Tax=Streptomyces dengpaensis TaxID=2049881 RepID=A0ABM6T163_9ACTN|nr:MULTISPECIES: SDR family NAD(P)-dependent oxidoreductase [Streptomyces]AVH60727.1 hypothetical protein C4B68_38825 [Streptomyces dengpaensis]PIB00364.1 hypothetical protein B1C81_38165 [Streptomyces sp. HG99]